MGDLLCRTDFKSQYAALRVIHKRLSHFESYTKDDWNIKKACQSLPQKEVLYPYRNRGQKKQIANKYKELQRADRSYSLLPPPPEVARV